MLKKMLCLISLSLCLVSCGDKDLPPFPEINQCLFVLNKEAPVDSRWLCTNTETLKQEWLALNDPRMDRAQAQSADDYKKTEQYVSDLKAIAQKKCTK